VIPARGSSSELHPGHEYLLEYDRACALEFGRLRGQLRRQGTPVGRLDLMIASTALVHDLTLVTHNTQDFKNVPGLRLEDWLQDRQ